MSLRDATCRALRWIRHVVVRLDHPQAPLYVRLLDLAVLSLGAVCLVAIAADLHLKLGSIRVSRSRPEDLAVPAVVLFLARTILWRGTAAVGRIGFVAGIAVLLVVLESTGWHRQVGDSGEYLGMAFHMSRGNGPAIPVESIPDVQRLGTNAPRVALSFPDLVGADGRQDMPHFWFYPALAAPFVRIGTALNQPVASGFIVLNSLLVLLAAWCLWRRLHPAAVVVVICGPILWWVDKAHPEIFTVALLCVAASMWRDRPWWTFVALGAASTQNPPIGGALVLAVAASALTPMRWSGKAWLGAGAGLALSALHPCYYWIRLGRWSGLSTSVTPHLPGRAELAAPLFDLNIGLVPNFPLFAAAVAAAVALVLFRAPRRLLSLGVVWPLAAGSLFLLSAAQTTNVNHGGTFGPSRYALWLIPLAAPLLEAVEGVAGRWWRAGLAALAVAGLVATADRARLNVPESFLRPSPLANYVWTRWPAIDNPLPEIFVDRVSGTETTILPVATAGCEKVLFAEGSRGPIDWPARCPPPADVTSETGPSGLWYANRMAGTREYTFARAPRQPAFVGQRPPAPGRPAQ